MVFWYRYAWAKVLLWRPSGLVRRTLVVVRDGGLTRAGTPGAMLDLRGFYINGRMFSEAVISRLKAHHS